MHFCEEKEVEIYHNFFNRSSIIAPFDCHFQLF